MVRLPFVFKIVPNKAQTWALFLRSFPILLSFYLFVTFSLGGMGRFLIYLLMCLNLCAALRTSISVCISGADTAQRRRASCHLSAAAAAASCQTDLGDAKQLLASEWLSLRRNLAAHARDVSQSPQLGYTRIKQLPPVAELPPVTSFKVDRQATGMGSACPFAAHDPHGTSPLSLLFQTETPLFSEQECQAIIDEGTVHIRGGGAGSGFTLADTNRNLAVASLPLTLAWLNNVGMPRVAALAGKCFGELAIGPAKDLLIYRALVVQYEYAAGLTHQKVHRDGALVTCVVPLNDMSEYTGGGTYMESLGYAVVLPRGHALMQASALRHAGHAIESGQRWVLVLFIIAEQMKYGEGF